MNDAQKERLAAIRGRYDRYLEDTSKVRISFKAGKGGSITAISGIMMNSPFDIEFLLGLVNQLSDQVRSLGGEI